MEELVQATNVQEAEENMEAEAGTAVEEEIIANEEAIEEDTEKVLAVNENGDIVEGENGGNATNEKTES